MNPEEQKFGVSLYLFLLQQKRKKDNIRNFHKKPPMEIEVRGWKYKCALPW
jgi:hypothetical protein